LIGIVGDLIIYRHGRSIEEYKQKRKAHRSMCKDSDVFLVGLE